MLLVLVRRTTLCCSGLGCLLRLWSRTIRQPRNATNYDFDEKNRRAASELIEFHSIQCQAIKTRCCTAAACSLPFRRMPVLTERGAAGAIFWGRVRVTASLLSPRAPHAVDPAMGAAKAVFSCSRASFLAKPPSSFALSLRAMPRMAAVTTGTAACCGHVGFVHQFA